MGSTTFPPITEEVRWIVYRYPVTISPNQVRIIQHHNTLYHELTITKLYCINRCHNFVSCVPSPAKICRTLQKATCATTSDLVNHLLAELSSPLFRNIQTPSQNLYTVSGAISRRSVYFLHNVYLHSYLVQGKPTAILSRTSNTNM